MTKINDIITKYDDTMLKLLDKSLKLKSTFVQGHFPGRNWIVLWMKMNEKSLKNSGKTYTMVVSNDKLKSQTTSPNCPKEAESENNKKSQIYLTFFFWGGGNVCIYPTPNPQGSTPMSKWSTTDCVQKHTAKLMFLFCFCSIQQWLLMG